MIHSLMDLTTLHPRYNFTEELHRSGRTALYRGHRREDDAPVLAIGPCVAEPGPRDIARLRHEYAVQKSLDLDEVVRAATLEERGADLLLVMEDPGGRTLRGVMQGAPPDLGQTLRIAVSIAEALHAVHLRGVIHKDIRPENVLVDPETGRARLMGFGASTRLAQEPPRFTGSEALEGMLEYMAPEQTGRVSRPLDRRADLYSLGVVLYEMLTGSLPFVTSDPLELVQCHLAKAPAPPHDHAPQVPPVLSDIVMKLLAKAARDRYQSGGGVAADLRECLSQWTATGAVAPFSPGQRDERGALRTPQRLYGREAELAVLVGAWDRACEGRAELVLISGPAGIGKSALAHGIHENIAGARGYFIAGKFEQLNRGVPYVSIAHAFQGLVHQLLLEREDTIARWRAHILDAVGSSGGMLIDLIPALSLLIGPQPPAPNLPGAAAQNLLARAFERFVRVFTTEEHPLVILLDDLQWADLGSLALLKILLTSPESGHLLLIGAYRSNEVEAGHPLLKLLGELEASASRTAIELAPLGPEEVGQLVADVLASQDDPRRVDPLSRCVFEQTQGNPFFLVQFLRALHKDGLILFNGAEGSFQWDLGRIQEKLTTQDVVVFLLERLRGLAPRTVDTLKLAACIGHRFEIRMLARVQGAPAGVVAASLWEALEEGILVPLGREYRYFYGSSGSLDPGLDTAFQFSHDRIQQAAYALIDEDHRAGVHLEIGRLLLGGDRIEAPPGQTDHLFEIVTQLNLGAALIGEPEERRSLARLDLDAGRKARSSAAYAAAAGFFAAGITALGASGWERSRDLAFALHLDRADCEAIAGAVDVAWGLQDVLLTHATTDLERAQVLDLRVVLYYAQGRSADAIEVGLDALRLLGIACHDTEDEWKAAAEAELEEVPRNMAGRTIDDVLAAPPLTDPNKRAALRLLMNLSPAAFGLRPNLSAWITVKPVNLSLKYGNSIESPTAYALHGANLVNIRSRPAEGYEFAKLGVTLHEKLGGGAGAGTLYYYFAIASHHSVHWRTTIEYFEKAASASLESGDFVYACIASSHRTLGRIALGDPLAAMRDDVEQLVALTQRAKVASSNAILTAARQMIENLLGRTQGPLTLSGDGFDEAEFVRMLESKGFKLPTSWYCTVKGELAYLYEDHETAVAMLTRAWDLGSLNFTTEICYFGSLAILAAQPGASEQEARLRAPLLARLSDALASSARHCGQNYAQKHLLVQAEAARVAGDRDRAIALYDEAIAAAEENLWIRDVALANELCARFYLSAGKTAIARSYMANAIHAYATWGATGKIRHIEERYPDLALAPAETLASRSAESFDSWAQLDTPVFIRALQALASELLPDKVFVRLMRIALESAGAQRGLLLLERDGDLVIEASAEAGRDDVSVGLAIPLDDGAELAGSVVRHVRQLREAVVLGDASQRGRFTADPYIVARRPKSIVCIAMAHQGRSQGVLYLENNAVTGAFTRGRVELLRLLTSQAAIFVDNARMYARVKAVTAELVRAKDALEWTNAALERSNAALERSNTELHRTNDRLSAELAERQHAEAVRASLQDEILRAQEQRLEELSTPLIPIAKGILAMPLIGTLDARRAQRMLEVVLEGAHARRAKVVIFDITGVRGVDTEVAGTLINAAGALRLLGAEVVLTGIDGQVAQALVGLGVDFTAMVTSATLESGIAHAISRVRSRS